MYVFAYICILTDTYVCVGMSVYLKHTHTYTHTHTHTHTCIHLSHPSMHHARVFHIHLYIHILCVCVHVCVCSCTYTYMCVYISRNSAENFNFISNKNNRKLSKVNYTNSYFVFHIKNNEVYVLLKL